MRISAGIFLTFSRFEISRISSRIVGISRISRISVRNLAQIGAISIILGNWREHYGVFPNDLNLNLVYITNFNKICHQIIHYFLSNLEKLGIFFHFSFVFPQIMGFFGGFFLPPLFPLFSTAFFGGLFGKTLQYFGLGQFLLMYAKFFSSEFVKFMMMMAIFFTPIFFRMVMRTIQTHPIFTMFESLVFKI